MDSDISLIQTASNMETTETDEDQVQSSDSMEQEVEAVQSNEKMEDTSGVSGVDAESVLPEEVWRLILEMLDSKDRWSCTSTCLLFDGILHSWKTGLMIKTALPHLYRYLSLSKLLECRLVCKSWNVELQNFFNDHPSLQPHQDNGDPRRLDFVYPVKEKSKGKKSTYRFNSKTDLSFLDSSRLKEMKAAGLNPFMGRYLNLILGKIDVFERNPEDGSVDHWWDKLFHFLGTFGKEIWYLSINFEWNSASDWMKQRVINFLTIQLSPLVPNLKKLYIGRLGYKHTAEINPEEVSLFPNLDTLETHSTDPILKAMVHRHYSQLRKLSLLRLFRNGFISNNSIRWPALVELHLDCGFRMDLARFSFNLGERMTGLRKLGLKSGLGDIDISDLDHFLNQAFAGCRLSTLRLIGSLRKLRRCQSSNFIAPERLTTLEIVDAWDFESICITCSTSVPTFNFLEGRFRSLHNIHLIWRETPPWIVEYGTEVDLMPRKICKTLANMRIPHEKVEVNKYIYDGEMYKSNIWEMLSRLKVFTFQWDVYTRDGYNEYRKRLGLGYYGIDSRG